LLVVIVVTYVLVSKGIVGPMRKMIILVQDIAEGEGDLTKRIVNN
jgi:methyl-accepting chemotaxis protein